MLPLPLLARCRSWLVASVLSLFACGTLFLLALSTPNPAQAQYPGGGGYPGGGSGGGSGGSGSHCWQITYSQTGTWSYADPNVPTTGQKTPHSDPVPTVGNGYGAGYSSMDDSVSVTVTATLTWIPATGQTMQSDPPPQQLNVLEYGSASEQSAWDGPAPAPGPTGSASDGLGDAQMPYGSGYISQGYHLVQKGSSSGTVTVTCSLSAAGPTSTWQSSGSGGGYPGGGYPGGGGPGYWDWIRGSSITNFTVYPVTADASGQTPTGSGPKLLTGQAVSATLGVPSPFSVDSTTYQWSATGDVFYTYNEHAPSHQLILLSDDPKYTTQPQFGLFDKSADTITITCNATIVCPDGTRLPVTASPPSITSVKPTASWDTGRDRQGKGFHFTTEGMGALEVWNPITITVPAPFSGGTGCLAQLITPVRRLTRNALNGQPTNYYFKIPQQNPDGTTTMVLPSRGLDTDFPYPGFNGGAATWDVSGSGASGDGPAMGFSTPPLDNGGSAWTKAYANDIFTTYLMYRPIGGVWVPIQRLDWGWHGDADNSLGYWSATGDDFMGPHGSNTSDPPRWNVVIEANDQLYP